MKGVVISSPENSLVYKCDQFLSLIEWQVSEFVHFLSGQTSLGRTLLFTVESNDLTSVGKMGQLMMCL